TFRGRDFLGTSEIVMYEPDSDVVRWGLNFLDVDQIFSSTYYGDNSQHDVDICREHYIRDNHHETEHSSTENDEILAHALQEELSHLSVVEEDESSHAVQEHLSAPTGTEDWCSPTSNYYYGHEGSLAVADDMGPSSSCSSPGDKSYDGEEYSYDLEITDEPELDGEVGKRLHQLIPVPHVPRINGDIPSIDEATSDHQRLLDRLHLFDLIEHRVQGDGNCQFRALSDQFYRTPEHHKFVRRQVVHQCGFLDVFVADLVENYQLKSQPELYEGYVPMAYGDYLKKIDKNGEWGDHYGVKIFVITSFKDTCSVEILPRVQKSKRVICLSFWAEVHYNSIYPQGDVIDVTFMTKQRIH
ncbi:hypothetical protein RJ639_023469, partial [Escallonia herrerae]